MVQVQHDPHHSADCLHWHQQRMVPCPACEKDSMSSETSAAQRADSRSTFEQSTVIAVLAALSLSHLLNDVMQSLLPAVYPLLKAKYSLSFFQIGLITFSFQVTASLLQPIVGLFTDRRPWAYTLLFGTLFTLLGLLGLAMAGSFAAILLAAALVGIGSSIFNPEASRVARLASGGLYGFAHRRAALPVYLPRRRRGRNSRRRARRRPARIQDGDLGLDPGRASVHARSAARELVLDGGADGTDRVDPRLGVLCHHRLRARV